MQIILLERVEKLGTIGDVVTVKDGYARNFLLPNKKALRANEANRKVFEANRERLVTENAERRTAAEAQGEKVEGAQVVLIRAASNAGQLYGSVSVRDIVAGLAEQGHDVDKRMVILGAPIKNIGMHDVTVALHPEVRVTVKANVARSDDEAKLQSILSALGGYVSAQVTNADPAAYGFDAPLATVRAASADGTVTLHYAENADGCWMMVEGDSSVYAVDLDTVQALLITAAALKTE